MKSAKVSPVMNDMPIVHIGIVNSAYFKTLNSLIFHSHSHCVGISHYLLQHASLRNWFSRVEAFMKVYFAIYIYILPIDLSLEKMPVGVILLIRSASLQFQTTWNQNVKLILFFFFFVFIKITNTYILVMKSAVRWINYCSMKSARNTGYFGGSQNQGYLSQIDRFLERKFCIVLFYYH